jgi:hypothetical protein
MFQNFTVIFADDVTRMRTRNVPQFCIVQIDAGFLFRAVWIWFSTFPQSRVHLFTVRPVKLSWLVSDVRGADPQPICVSNHLLIMFGTRKLELPSLVLASQVDFISFTESKIAICKPLSLQKLLAIFQFTWRSSVWINLITLFIWQPHIRLIGSNQSSNWWRNVQNEKYRRQ